MSRPFTEIQEEAQRSSLLPVGAAKLVLTSSKYVFKPYVMSRRTNHGQVITSQRCHFLYDEGKLEWHEVSTDYLGSFVNGITFPEENEIRRTQLLLSFMQKCPHVQRLGLVKSRTFPSASSQVYVKRNHNYSVIWGPTLAQAEEMSRASFYFNYQVTQEAGTIFGNI